MGDLVARAVAFVRAGYAHGAPTRNYVPLLALLRRRLSDEEVSAVASHLTSDEDRKADLVDIGVAITRVTDELPSTTDLHRVQQEMDTSG